MILILQLIIIIKTVYKEYSPEFFFYQKSVNTKQYFWK